MRWANVGQLGAACDAGLALLAQAAPGTAGTPATPTASDPRLAGVMLWVGVFFLGLMLLALAWFVARRWLVSADTDAAAGAFTLSDLRDMKAKGMITAEEFERAKAAVVSRELEAMKRKEPGPPDPDDRLA